MSKTWKKILDIRTLTQYLCRIGLVKGDSILLRKINIFNFSCSWLVGTLSYRKAIQNIQQCTKMSDIEQHPSSNSLQLNITQKNIFWKNLNVYANSCHSLHCFYIQRLKLKAIPSQTLPSSYKNLHAEIINSNFLITLTKYTVTYSNGYCS